MSACAGEYCAAANDGDDGRRPTASPSIKLTNKKNKRNGIFDVQRIRKYLTRTNIDVIAIGLILALYHVHSAQAKSGGDDHHDSASEGDHHDSATTHDAESSHGHDTEAEHEIIHEEHTEVEANLFPWFAEIIGVFAYYFLSRYMHAIPYTAVMFIIGACIGYSTGWGMTDRITMSATTWVGIEGHVILLVFLPGLLYLDSYLIDVHLFVASLPQLLTFAFPMVLGGTALTALVAFYIFPYGWPLDLCMTFGAILAATDPVAVAVLLNELGAPPRLKMHVSGESLLNDGSAVVFYIIFSDRFKSLLGIEGFGEDIGWAEGFRMFFQLALGGCAIGIAFGVGLLVILYNLNRRLSGEDSVVQVVATISTAYLVFFTSEILCDCSGIIAVVFCGITTKAFGETLYNDSHLSHHFWHVTEFLLNTLLFVLGGTVWGNIISRDGSVTWEALDWAFLFALYALVTAIRFFLVFAFYPITSRIGVGSSWQEAVFMSYGGLRGAVGIALALSLNAEVNHFTSVLDEEIHQQYTEYTLKLFGMVGGIALLTLVINGPTSGPLLKKLGLVTPTKTREKIVQNYHDHMIQNSLTEFVALLCEERFHDLDFTVVKTHVPYLKDITYTQLMEAVKKHEEDTPSYRYHRPNLKNVLPYLVGSGADLTIDQGFDDFAGKKRASVSHTAGAMRQRRMSAANIRKHHGNRGTVFDMSAHYTDSDVEEERMVFMKILRTAYHTLVETGELEGRGFVAYSLKTSVDYADDNVGRGLPMSDWNALLVASDSFLRRGEVMLQKLERLIKCKKGGIDGDYHLIFMKVQQVLAFTRAHAIARSTFKREFSKGGEGHLTAAEKVVMDESDKQVELASEALDELDDKDVAIVKSHYACQILLNKSAHYFKRMKDHGLMSDKEAGEFLEEIEKSIHRLLGAGREIGVQAGKMTDTQKKARITQFSKDIVAEGPLSSVEEDMLAPLLEE